MTTTIEIGSHHLSLEELEQAIRRNIKIALSAEAIEKVNGCRAFLDEAIKDESKLYYGINTGFGGLCNIRIAPEEIEHLQLNLLRSHACGMGDEVPEDIVRLMLLLKAKGLALGHSGVQLGTVQRLLDFFNEGVHPIVYQLGSLGASGDLAPLAHLCLPLIDSGTVRYRGEVVNGNELNQQLGWQPIALKAKEGLALINGTQFMTAYGCHILIRAKRLARLADLIAAISLDAFECNTQPFHHLIQKVRPHEGQRETAERILRYLADSPMAASPKSYVQDPYSFRCIPQVHGAAKDVIRHVSQIFETEINSVTDNPLIFPETGEILSGGNFHGQPLAYALDYLGIAMADMANISERRTYQMLIGWRKLPPFLTKQSGLHSGLMIAQYTVAAMVSQNKQLATPASLDTITSSAGQEDHVSMGANAATKTYRILENAERIIAAELLIASQALELRRPSQSSPIIEKVLTSLRSRVPFLNEDRELYKDMHAALEVLRSLEME